MQTGRVSYHFAYSLQQINFPKSIPNFQESLKKAQQNNATSEANQNSAISDIRLQKRASAKL